MKERFLAWRPRQEAREKVDLCNAIIAEYQAEGLSLTLRQLYYQLVARDKIANNQKSYNRLGTIVSRGRKAGMISWLAIEDRTRNLETVATWDSPAEILQTASRQYKRDIWADQSHRIEVFVEKEALSGVVERACREFRVPYFSCRGYSSDSESWRASKRAINAEDNGQLFTILHLGDHDPSGIDMSRDIQDRFELYGAEIEFERLALNMDQVERLNPPPNPAKLTDTRSESYVKKYGQSSWELDAINPMELVDIIQEQIRSRIDDYEWGESLAIEKKEKQKLLDMAEEFGS